MFYKKAKDTTREDFAYTIGVIRTLETLLANGNEIERMTLAKNANDAFDIFNETDYADNTADIKSPAEFQTVITEGLKDVQELLTKLSPDKRILNVILLTFDFHNIKTLIKGKLGGKKYEEIEHLMIELGMISPVELKKMIFDEEKTQFNINEEDENDIKVAINKAFKIFEKNENPQEIDLLLDKEMMALIHKTIESEESDFLHKYFEKYVDLLNIKLFFRMKVRERALKNLKAGLINNGSVTTDKFISLYSESLENFTEKMNTTGYGKIVEEGLRGYKEEGTLLHLEKECENHLTSYIKLAKQMPFGPEPLISYFLAKTNNALTIRMIMISKLNKIDPEEIKPRLRKLYV